MNRIIQDTLKNYGVTLETGVGDCVTSRPLPRAVARALVADLRHAGLEASDAPDNDTPDVAWVYVTEVEP